MRLLPSIIFFLVIVVPSLSIHEYAHAWASTRLGDVTPRLNGRLTINPLAHIDPVGTLIVPMILLISGASVIGRAKPVPINPYTYRKPILHEFLVAMAGPISNILLGTLLVIVMVMYAFATGEASGLSLTHPNGMVVIGLHMAALTNFMLAFFNLLPIPPLDGYRIITLIMPSTREWILQYQQYIGFVLIAMMISPIGSYIVNAIARLSEGLYGLLIMLLTGL